MSRKRKFEQADPEYDGDGNRIRRRKPRNEEEMELDVGSVADDRFNWNLGDGCRRVRPKRSDYS